MVGTPLIILVEAKKNDFDQGWGQCIAEIIAAQKINADTDFPVYGIVSDGTLWQFGIYLPVLFGAIHAIFKASTESLSETD